MDAENKIRSTTVIAVRKDGKVITGFAGATADAFTLFDKFEEKLKAFNGDLTRSAVELAKLWRTERSMSKLEALLLVADSSKILLISGGGDVIEPENDILAIGSGGNYAYAAAMAYMESSSLSAKEIAEKSLRIAGQICIYTNNNVVVEEL